MACNLRSTSVDATERGRGRQRSPIVLGTDPSDLKNATEEGIVRKIRRSVRVGAGALATTALIAGCAVNPVTGDREIALISESQEIEIGREADRQIVATMGVYEDAEMNRYVSDLGRRLAAVSERPDLPWTFRVVDDPAVNAFALPGGFVYVTRGMMTHLTSEAQLAGILGHEIGHITARHSVQQISRSQLASLGLGVGMIFVPELRPFGDVAGAGLQLMFLKFSRDDERQSDELGIQYMTAFEYDPAELAHVFRMLERMGEASGSSVPGWASTHPAPGDRQQQILARAEAHPSADVVRRAELLQKLDGTIFGPNPREGFVENGTFHHPDLKFRLRFPEGWRIANSRSAVQGLSPDDRAAMALQLSEEGSPQAAARAFASTEGVRVTDTSERSVNGLPAAWAAFEVATQQGRLLGTALFVSLDGRVYAIYGYAGERDWSGHRSRVEASLASFDRETDARILAAQPDRVDLVSLRATLRFEEFVDRYPSSVPASVVALINQVEPRSSLSQGLVKRVVGE